MAARIRKGDKVVVLAGRDKGKEGEVLRVFPKKERALVLGVNTVKRHTPPSAADPGGIVTKESSVHISNLAVVDPKTGKGTKTGFRLLENGKKVRYSKDSGEVIDA